MIRTMDVMNPVEADPIVVIGATVRLASIAQVTDN
jgi:hypothetical protein